MILANDVCCLWQRIMANDYCSAIPANDNGTSSVGNFQVFKITCTMIYGMEIKMADFSLFNPTVIWGSGSLQVK
jgi:hypothetical protein